MAINYSKLHDNSPKAIKFVLDSEIGTFDLDYVPLEWKNASIEFNRDFKFGGVFTQFTTAGLTFIKDGRAVLTDLWNQRGFFAICNLRVFEFNYLAREYVEFPSQYKLDFNTYREVMTNGGITGVNIMPLNVDILAKIKQRSKINVDLTRLNSLSGYQIVIKDHWLNLKKYLAFGEINAYRTANWHLALTDEHYTDNVNATVPVPTGLIFSDFDEAQGTTFVNIAGNYKSNSYLRETIQNRTINFNFQSKINFSGIGTGAPEDAWSITVFCKRIIVDGLNGIVSDVEVGVVHIISSHETSGTKTFTYSAEENINAGESIGFYYDVEITGDVEYTLVAETGISSCSEGVITAPPRTVESFPIYEATERNLQLIMDLQYPLYSEFLGRTDVIFNNNGDMYQTEQQTNFANILNGLCLRGLILSDAGNSVSVNFDDLFKTLNSVWNVGMGIEYFEGLPRVRIEQWSYFFSNNIILDLRSRVSPQGLIGGAFPDESFIQIKSGFKSFDYEAINGRGEYNTTNERTSIIPNDNSFDLISSFRGDTKGIAMLLENPLLPGGEGESSGSIDQKADNDIFIIKTQRNGDQWKAETDENITIIENTSLFQNGSLNLFFTPTRNLFRHGNRIKSGLIKELSSYLRFQKTDKSSILKSSDGVTTIEENEDIQVQSLADPLYEPFVYEIDIPFFRADLAAVVNNPRGLVRLTDNISGWIYKLKFEPANNKANILIIKKYVNN